MANFQMDVQRFNRRSVGTFGCCFVLTWLMVVATASAELGGTPRPILANLDHLNLAKQLWQAGDPTTTVAVARVIADANKKLTAGPYSVVFSPYVAPSGDIHDFVSYGAYWWPNPDTADGLPWLRRDGFVNPQNNADGQGSCDLSRTVSPLSLAYFFTGDEVYAEKTASLLRTWFLDEATYMNPKNEYAQIIPGTSPGTFDVPGFGNCMPQTFDAAGILESSAAWTADDKQRLQQWASDLMHWAETSKQGRRQFEEPSNHGTNYDFLKAFFGAYDGEHEETIESLQYYGTRRMRGQVSAEDGSNPLEFQRANNLLYHRYNLGRAWDLANVGRHVDGLNLFEYETEDGKSLRKQLDFLLPYMLGAETWDRWPGEPFKLEFSTYYEMLRMAAIFYQEPLLLDAADSIGTYSTSYIDLLYPRQLVREKVANDLNADGVLSVADIDLLNVRIRSGKSFKRYDLNHDNRLDETDRQIFIEDRLDSVFGDANLDGRFSSGDLVSVWQAGEYSDEWIGNSTWGTGDWNGDGEFTENDFIVALTRGNYEGTDAATAVVPEPAGIMPLAWALAVSACHQRRRAAARN